MQIVKNMKRNKVITIINNATFGATVIGDDITFTEFENVLLTFKTGALTNAPTLDIKVQVKDSVGNYIDHTTLNQVTTATGGYEELYGLAANTIRVVCTYGGTGSFAATTVEVTMAR